MRLTTVLGLPLGLLLGYLLEYRDFNMGTALRGVMFKGPKNDLRAYLMILVVNILAVHLLAAIGLLRVESVPFFWPAVAVGGFLFGLGMSFGTGCTNVWHRPGTGASGLVFALLGFMIGTHAIRTPLFSTFFLLLRRHVIDFHGGPPTLYALLAPHNATAQWVVAAGASGLLALWLWRLARKDWVVERSWLPTGLMIGVVAVAGWIVGNLDGDTYGLSFTHPTLALGRILFVGDLGALYWGVLMLLGVPIGVFLAARRKRTLHFHVPGFGKLLRLTGSGTLTGVGASIAGGCNVGHGITGISILSVSSVTATLSAMAAVWLSTTLGDWFGGGKRSGERREPATVSLSADRISVR